MPDKFAMTAADLIADLPDSASDLGRVHLARLIALRSSLSQAMGEALDRMQVISDAVESRGGTEGPLTDHLTATEVADLDSAQRTLLDTERAVTALDEWDYRSGRTPRPPESQVVISEDPDGTVTWTLPEDA